MAAFDRTTTFTEFDLPSEEDISQVFQSEGTELVRKWTKVLQPLREAEGWEGGSWGRIVERPQTILLVSGINSPIQTLKLSFFDSEIHIYEAIDLIFADWKSRQYLDDFQNSPGYSTYADGLAALGQCSSVEVAFPSRVVRIQPSRPTITKVYFPNPVTTEQREAVAKNTGIHIMGGFSTNSRERTAEGKLVRKYKHDRGWLSLPPSRGWKLGLEKKEDLDMEVCVWIHYWTSPEKESDGKSSLAPNIPYKKGNNMSHLGCWQQQMREAGAVDFEEEHWECHSVPKTSEAMSAGIAANLEMGAAALRQSFSEVYVASELP